MLQRGHLRRLWYGDMFPMMLLPAITSASTRFQSGNWPHKWLCRSMHAANLSTATSKLASFGSSQIRSWSWLRYFTVERKRVSARANAKLCHTPMKQNFELEANHMISRTYIRRWKGRSDNQKSILIPTGLETLSYVCSTEAPSFFGVWRDRQQSLSP